MREYQVRFCEGLGVKFPGPTRREAGRFYQRGIFSGAKDRGHQLWFSLIAMGYYLIEWLALRTTSAVMRWRSCAGR